MIGLGLHLVMVVKLAQNFSPLIHVQFIFEDKGNLRACDAIRRLQDKDGSRDQPFWSSTADCRGRGFKRWEMQQKQQTLMMPLFTLWIVRPCVPCNRGSGVRIPIQLLSFKD